MDSSAAPAPFRAALASLKNAKIRPEVKFSEAPAPHRIAPFAVAIDGELLADFASDEGEPNLGASASSGDLETLPQGTFVLLFDPQGQDNWDGQFRVVTYMEMEVDRAEAADPLLPGVAWTWVTDGIGHHPVRGLSGTVTLLSSSSFGETGEKPGKSVLQIRASWSPTSEQVGPHLSLWADMLALAGGLEGLPSEVTSLEEFRCEHHHANHPSHHNDAHACLNHNSVENHSPQITPVPGSFAPSAPVGLHAVTLLPVS